MQEYSDTQDSNSLVLIAKVMKPFGLTGEMKIKPETDDLSMHSSLETVYYKKNHNSVSEALKISASRLHQSLWYMTFSGVSTPESAKQFSGGLLFIPKTELKPLPDNMVYMDDIIGYDVIDTKGKLLGVVAKIEESPAHDLIVITPEQLKANTQTQNYLVPWIDNFVKKIDTETSQIIVDFTSLEGLYAD
ncbi:MAG: 16S rRNA processing protein RimM [Fibrobacteria bacterium]|nr:16S rRNA processing protein RimM [Fibrobacteria bacterium]